jgi:PadR family transcriptional regulator AphA
MSLEYAILGFLEMEPHAGYDLKKRFARTVNNFWPADQSRIYRTLARLLEEGYITQQIIVQTDRPNRKVHHITDSGRQKLREWLDEAKPGSPLRSSWLVQLFFLGLLDASDAVRILEEKKARIQATLDSYPERFNLTPTYQHAESKEVDFFEWLVLDSAIHMRHALLEWIDDVIGRIRAGEHKRGREGALCRWLRSAPDAAAAGNEPSDSAPRAEGCAKREEERR